MRCLWLTLADPEPRHNGQYVYSGGLIDSVAATGSEIAVLGLRRPDSPPRHNGTANGNGHDAHVEWCLPGEPLDPLHSRWGSLASTLPHIAYRCRTAAMRHGLRELLVQGGWNAIVFDGISVGWALSPVQDFYAGREEKPRLIYVSHNHEESLRQQVAASQREFFRRQAVRFDAAKVSRLERDLVDQVDFVTAITPEDLELYSRRRGSKPMGVLTPGYRGRKLGERRLAAGVPRRAVIVGSFDWIAKRMNLEEFVEVADPLFAAAGAELMAVGMAEERFLKGLRQRTQASTFTGTVPDVTRYMDEARIAIVPERNGGGFKLKVLEYIFNRLPVFALRGSFAGVPLVHGESVMLYDDHEALARGVLDTIDDLDRLNGLQERAFAACRDHFDWASRGHQILSLITS